MKIIDMSTILNAEFANETNAENTTMLATDLSNLYDFGKAYVFGQNLPELESALKGVVTKISKTIFETSTYVSNAPDILKDSSEYLGTIETLRLTLPNTYDTNTSWDVVTEDENNSFERMFGYKGIEVKSNYTDKTRTFEIKISKTAEQFRDAFQSADKMIRFFNEIETLVNNYMAWAIDKLCAYTFVNGVVGAVNDRGENIVLNGGSSTADTVNTIKKVLRRFKDFSNAYKSTDFVTATKETDLKMYVNGDWYDEMTTALADVRHPDFLEIPMENIQTMNFFQSQLERDKISAKVANGTGVTTISNIIAVIADKRAMATTVSNRRVAVVPVPNMEFSNYFYKFSGQSYNNLDYPIVIITKNGYSDVSTS